MIISLKVLFLILACVLFFFAAFVPYFMEPTSRFSRFNMMSAGLFFYAVKDMVP